MILHRAETQHFHPTLVVLKLRHACNFLLTRPTQTFNILSNSICFSNTGTSALLISDNQSLFHSSQTMPRKRRLADNAEQNVRRGTRNRIVKQRPDFVDPFSLRKKRRISLDDGAFSPLSSLSDASVQVRDDVIDNQNHQYRPNLPPEYLPLKKRVSMRVPVSTEEADSVENSTTIAVKDLCEASPHVVRVRPPRLYIRLRLREATAEKISFEER